MRPQQQILHKRPKPDEQQGRGGALEQIVDGGDAAVGVAGRRRETEEVRGQRAVDVESSPGDGAGAQRIAVGAVERTLEPDGVALQLLDDGQQIVGDGRRLCPLGVRMHREDRVVVPATRSSSERRSSSVAAISWSRHSRWRIR